MTRRITRTRTAEGRILPVDLEAERARRRRVPSHIVHHITGRRGAVSLRAISHGRREREGAIGRSHTRTARPVITRAAQRHIRDMKRPRTKTSNITSWYAAVYLKT